MIYALCLFFMVSWLGLQCVIVAFPGPETATEIKGSVLASSDRY